MKKEWKDAEVVVLDINKTENGKTRLPNEKRDENGKLINGFMQSLLS